MTMEQEMKKIRDEWEENGRRKNREMEERDRLAAARPPPVAPTTRPARLQPRVPLTSAQEQRIVVDAWFETGRENQRLEREEAERRRRRAGGNGGDDMDLS